MAYEKCQTSNCDGDMQPARAADELSKLRIKKTTSGGNANARAAKNIVEGHNFTNHSIAKS